MIYQKLFKLLMIVNCLAVHWAVSTDKASVDTRTFSQRIDSLQDETSRLCSYIQDISIVAVKQFKNLMQDAHKDCPNLKELDVSLYNIATQADKYFINIAKQQHDCGSILFMLIKSLDSGDIVKYHLNEGNYSLVTNTIDKWYQSFSDLKSDAHTHDIPLDIIINNKKSFFYYNWLSGATYSAVTLFTILTMSLFILKIVTAVGLALWITNIFYPNSAALNTNPKKISSENDLSKKESGTALLPEKNQTLDDKKIEISPIDIERNKMLANVTKGLWIAIIAGLVVMTILLCPSMFSFSNSKRYNWFPAATATIDKMNSNRDEIQLILDGQIKFIEELQNYVNMYHDVTIQQNTNILMSNLAAGIKHASKEISDLYMASASLPSAFDQAYTNIEAKAKKAGRLEEANSLLNALEETKIAHGRFQRSVETLMINQETLLPILTEQTKVMHAHVQQGCLLDIHQIAKEHMNTTMYLDGYACNVTIAIQDIITIVGNDNDNGMKKAIEELKIQIADDQYKSTVYGIVAGIGGTIGTTSFGMVALKSGFAIISITATAVAVPAIATVGAVGTLGVGAYAMLAKYEQYTDASLYQVELDVLEAQRGNFRVALEHLEKANNQQREASKEAQKALNRIITHSASFSSIPGFILPTEKRIALSNELLHILQQYNEMSSALKQFKSYTTDNNQKRLKG